MFWSSALRVTARIAAFMPGASPPEVRTAMLFIGRSLGSWPEAVHRDGVLEIPGRLEQFQAQRTGAQTSMAEAASRVTRDAFGVMSDGRVVERVVLCGGS